MAKTVAVLVFLFAACIGAVAENRSALLIANGAYTNFDRLATPLPEARALKATLEKLGFAVTLIENSSREAMLDALSNFEQELRRRGGIAFFHYGGHGVQVAGKNFLLPADADIPDERRVATRAVDVDEVMASLDASGSDANIVVLDACRNNPLPASSTRAATRGLAVAGTKPKNTIIIYSAESGSVALEGLFTPALIRALATPGMSLGDVVMQVRREVYEKSNGAQTPGEYNQLFAPVYLAGSAGKNMAATASSSAPTVPTLSVTRSYGSLSIMAAATGTLYLDGVAMGELPAGSKAKLDSVEAGDRRLELRYLDGQVEKKSAAVEEGRTVSVSFAYKKASPQAAPGTAVSGDLSLVKGGTFTMGYDDGESDEIPLHKVTISDFYLGKHEVTQGLYQSIVGMNPSLFKGDPNLPVDHVSWYDALAFCNKLSEKEGLSKVYAIDGTVVTADWKAKGYRLPTEAEWEYAAKGGQKGLARTMKFAGSNYADDVAWYIDISSGKSGVTTHPVGTKAANELGLYDMSGNVEEWCWDIYGKYPSGSQVDPVGPSSGRFRVYRGGSVMNRELGLRTANRENNNPLNSTGGGNGALGFRVACRP